jgi:uncharacterized sporulation protein YeaH/YhbH (DUF444 family)
MWQVAKSFNMYSMIKNQIRDKKELRTTKKSAFKSRIDGIQTQIKMKKEVLRQHKRRVAQDPGSSPARNEQKENFRLYGKLVRDVEKEIASLEKELTATMKEKDAEIKALDAEIKVLEANLKLY